MDDFAQDARRVIVDGRDTEYQYSDERDVTLVADRARSIWKRDRGERLEREDLIFSEVERSPEVDMHGVLAEGDDCRKQRRTRTGRHGMMNQLNTYYKRRGCDGGHEDGVTVSIEFHPTVRIDGDANNGDEQDEHRGGENDEKTYKSPADK
ncbi:hypothetical protein EDC04DRAFT_2604198 [Pisolithus marmoratus]|nr:hypothetical protein EDC04DRAFT_2604198 [Pisolithus marmoratus]